MDRVEVLRGSERFRKSNGGRGLLVPWRPNGHHDYGIGARCKVHASNCETFPTTSVVAEVLRLSGSVLKNTPPVDKRNR